MGGLRRALTPRRVGAGLVLAAVGVLLCVVGGATLLLWPLAAVGLFAVGVVVMPQRHTVDLTIAPTDDDALVREALDSLMIALRFKVADDVMDHVKSCRASILLTLEVQAGRVAGDPTVHLIRRTALDYLQATMQTYLELPRVQAEQRPVADGRTPHDVLIEQLELMDSRLRDAADAILAHDSEKLITNGRFLADRFAVSSLTPDARNWVSSHVAAPVQTTVPAEVAVPVDLTQTAAPVPVAEQEHVQS